MCEGVHETHENSFKTHPEKYRVVIDTDGDEGYGSANLFGSLRISSISSGMKDCRGFSELGVPVLSLARSWSRYSRRLGRIIWSFFRDNTLIVEKRVPVLTAFALSSLPEVPRAVRVKLNERYNNGTKN